MNSTRHCHAQSQEGPTCTEDDPSNSLISLGTKSYNAGFLYANQIRLLILKFIGYISELG